jgi:hypothetical protein
MCPPETGVAAREESTKPPVSLHIFVNRKKFDEAGGVKPVMKGREIAELVKIPPDNAVVRRGNTADSPVVGLDEEIEVKEGEHFLVTRKTVEGGFDVPERIRRELEVLAAGGLTAEYVNEDGRGAVIYRNVTTAGRARGLPERTDVLVPVPGGYPGGMIDMAALPLGSPLLGRVKGSPNQAILTAIGVQWSLVSYHPHNGGGAPPWDQMRHGFHTYYDEVVTWLAVIA